MTRCQTQVRVAGRQYVEVTLNNVDENLQVLPGPITVVDKYREEAGCEGIVK
ncbi:MAG: hypothetical protein ACYC2O_06495 [Microthrixaceae bacterium]